METPKTNSVNETISHSNLTEQDHDELEAIRLRAQASRDVADRALRDFGPSLTVDKYGVVMLPEEVESVLDQAHN